MMLIEGYGIQLVRLKAAHLEMLRQQRNSAFIRGFMEYRDYISPAMQLHWFQSIDNRHNNYFLIRFENRFIGLINGADIDWQKKETRSGGIFLWEKEFLDSTIPLRASFLLTDISFLLGLERTYVKVLRTNANAIAFNKALGYELLPSQENEENQQYVLTKESYERKTGKIRELLRKEFPYPMITTIDDPENDSEKFIGEHYPNLPASTHEILKLLYA